MRNAGADRILTETKIYDGMNDTATGKRRICEDYDRIYQAHAPHLYSLFIRFSAFSLFQIAALCCIIYKNPIAQ